MITTESIHRILLAMGVRPETAALYAPHLDAAARGWGVADYALPMWLAQLAHESALFERTVENLNYTTAAQIRKTWPKRFPSDAAAMPYVRNPRRLACEVYGNRLGNSGPASGDGWKYRGRGLIQLTGRAHYAAAEDALGLPLLESPELLEEPAHAAAAAGWYWNFHDLNRYAGDVEECTRVINGGRNGIDDRRRLYGLALAAAEFPLAHAAEGMSFGAEQ